MALEPQNLFSSLYVDYVQSIFFSKPNEKFTIESLNDGLPPLIKQKDVVNAAFHILLMKEKIVQDGASDRYMANPIAIKEKLYDEKTQRSIIRLTEQNLRLQNRDLQTKIIWGVMGIIAGIIGSNLKAFLESIESLFR